MGKDFGNTDFIDLFCVEFFPRVSRIQGQTMLQNLGPSLHWSCLSPGSKHYSKEGSARENENLEKLMIFIRMI